MFPKIFLAVISDKNQQWIRNQIYFLFIVPVVIFVVRNSTVPLNKGHSEEGQVEKKTCCLLLLNEILFVSWCQTFSYILGTHYIIQQKLNKREICWRSRFVFRERNMKRWIEIIAVHVTSFKLFVREFRSIRNSAKLLIFLQARPLVSFPFDCSNDKERIQRLNFLPMGRYIFMHIHTLRKGSA